VKTLPDARGHFGRFGGRFVPETLMGALEQLQVAWAALRHDPVFWAELRELLARFAGRPTALYRADRLAAAVIAEAARLRATPARASASTSSAKTSLTRAPTRSTTPSARRS
jgi:hypothetical protein